MKSFHAAQLFTLLLGICLCCFRVSYALEEQFDCMLQPYTDVDVSSTVNGTIEEVSVERGDLVNKGQVLAVLDSRLERVSYELAKAKVESNVALEESAARIEYSERKAIRMNELREERYVSDEQVDDADYEKLIADFSQRTEYDKKKIERLELKRAEVMLDMKVIKSPVNGFVVDTYKTQGELLQEEPVVRIVQVDPLKVEAWLPVDKLGGVSVGDTVSIIPEFGPGKVLYGAITIVDPIVDAASGLFGIEAQIPNSEFTVKPGLKCTMIIQ